VELESRITGYSSSSYELYNHLQSKQLKEISEQELNRLNMQQLKNLAKQPHIKVYLKGVQKKKELLSRFKEKRRRMESAQAEDYVLQDISKGSFSKEAPPHEFYGNNFNKVDRHNRLFYQFPFSYSLGHWRRKFVISALIEVTSNAFVIDEEFTGRNHKKYLSDLAYELLQY
jgi:hypothetical protein